MKAAIFEEFAGPIAVEDAPDPTPPSQGVVIRTEATGVCRSDRHGWMGHDPEIDLPYVPGHELAGLVEEVGSGATQWKPGDRVTLPLCLRLRYLPSVCFRQPQGLRQPVPAGIHSLGIPLRQLHAKNSWLSEGNSTRNS